MFGIDREQLLSKLKHTFHVIFTAGGICVVLHLPVSFSFLSFSLSLFFSLICFLVLPPSLNPTDNQKSSHSTYFGAGIEARESLSRYFSLTDSLWWLVHKDANLPVQSTIRLFSTIKTIELNCSFICSFLLLSIISIHMSISVIRWFVICWFLAFEFMILYFGKTIIFFIHFLTCHSYFI